MSDLPNTSADAPIVTAAADNAPTPEAHKVVGAVVSTVQAHPAVPASKVASVAAAILQSLAAASPSLFAISRASSRTQAEVSLGLGLTEAILGAFIHPQADGGSVA
jgi:hypothetical protein